MMNKFSKALPKLPLSDIKKFCGAAALAKINTFIFLMLPRKAKYSFLDRNNLKNNVFCLTNQNLKK